MNNEAYKSLDGKIILVTGGSGLIGRSIIRNITAKGGLAINMDINIDTNFEEGMVFCDITSDDCIKESMLKVFNYYGRIDGLVNNAYPRTSDWGKNFEEMNPISLRKNVDWQMNSYIICCQELIKLMLNKSEVAIVNIASIYGIVGNDFSLYSSCDMEPPAAYSAIKGGIINFSRFLASKYGHLGIRVNCISPGGIFDHQPQSFVNAYEQKVPMRRMGTPEDISPAVSFLLSDESKYIIGHNLIVDGGWTII